MFGTLKEVILPAANEVQELVDGVFDSSGLNLIEIPFSIESARSSYRKILTSSPPNAEKDQQFKDGVIWADCLRLLETNDVTLVTDDKAFYSGRQLGASLAPNLLKEAKEYAHKIRVVHTLSALLDIFPKNIHFDDVKLVETVLVAAKGCVDGLIANEFEIGRVPRVIRSIFATENPDKLFFDCSIEIACPDISGKDRGDALLTLEADGLYSCENNAVDEISMKRSGFTFINESAEEVRRRDVWLRAGVAVAGHREVTSVIREKLHSS